jgi:hypothetical protein
LAFSRPRCALNAAPDAQRYGVQRRAKRVRCNDEMDSSRSA